MQNCSSFRLYAETSETINDEHLLELLRVLLKSNGAASLDLTGPARIGSLRGRTDCTPICRYCPEVPLGEVDPPKLLP